MGGGFKLQVLIKEFKCGVNQIANFKMYVYDTQPNTLSGVCNDFVFIGRLDNLALIYCALLALFDISLQNHYL